MIATFVWHYVVPPAFFVFAYSRIVGVIRRQNRVVCAAVETTASTTGSSSTQTTTGGATAAGKKHHCSQVNVVRTMVIVVLCLFFTTKPTVWLRVTLSILCQMGRGKTLNSVSLSSVSASATCLTVKLHCSSAFSSSPHFMLPALQRLPHFTCTASLNDSSCTSHHFSF